MISFLSLTILNAEIVEVTNIKEIYDHITPQSLILFDIDNTLLELAQTLGGDQWFYHQWLNCQSQGLSAKETEGNIRPIWRAIQSVSDVNLVEEDAADIVKDLRDRGYNTIALTTRMADMYKITERQLNKKGIDFSEQKAPFDTEVLFDNTTNHVLFTSGILLTSNTNKGKALMKFVDIAGYAPKHVVFINDKRANLRDIEVACEENNIPFIGLRYGYLDEKVKNIRMDIADVQLELFGKLISDDEAQAILQYRQNHHPDHL